SYHGAFTAICQSWGFFNDPRGMAAKLCRDCPMGINGLWPICKTERPRLGCGAHSNAAGVPYDTTRPPVGSAANLTADNQMTRKPNLALNAEIVRSGRAANCATTTARDPEIIDPITVECVKWLERNTETLRSGAAWDKRSSSPIAIAGSTVRRNNRSRCA